MTFHLMFVNIIFSLVWVAEWSSFGKELLTRLTICSLCILTICNIKIVNSRFGFEGGICVLIVPILGHCILVTFHICKSKGADLLCSNCTADQTFIFPV